MKHIAGELVMAVVFISAAAYGMQLLGLLMAVLHTPMDKMFIAAGAVCYSVFRLAMLMTDQRLF